MIRNDAENLALFQEACKGNEDAVDFLVRMADIIKAWDDFYDNEPVTALAIDKALADSLFGLEDNSFYKIHRNELWPILLLSWLGWKDANALRESGQHNKPMARVLKNYCDNLVLICAFICGGMKHASDMSMKVREHYLGTIHDGGR